MELGSGCNFTLNILKIVFASLSLHTVLASEVLKAGAEPSEESKDFVTYIVSAIGCVLVVGYVVKGRYDTFCLEHASDVERISKAHKETVKKLQDEYEKQVEEHNSKLREQ